MDALTLYGVCAVVAMLVFYTLEGRHPGFVLAFAVACLASSVYGFLQGAWPFGIVEAVWTAAAVRRWWVRVRFEPLGLGNVPKRARVWECRFRRSRRKDPSR
jgi:hypothetical protein